MKTPARLSKAALLRRYAPITQAIVDLPAHAPRNRTPEQADARRRLGAFLWDDEARVHLEPKVVMVTPQGRAVEVARDADGQDWQLVHRQLEWRLSLSRVVAANPDAPWESLGLPEWEPDNAWVPTAPREEWLAEPPRGG
jgi:hypothetical protein